MPTLLPQLFCIGGRAAVTACVDAATARINGWAGGLQATMPLHCSSGQAIQANASAPAGVAGSLRGCRSADALYDRCRSLEHSSVLLQSDSQPFGAVSSQLGRPLWWHAPYHSERLCPLANNLWPRGGGRSSSTWHVQRYYQADFSLLPLVRRPLRVASPVAALRGSSAR